MRYVRKRSSHEQGFAVLEALLTIIIMAAIAGTGWYVWHAKQTADEALKVAQNEPSTTNAQTSRKVGNQDCKLADGSLGKYLSMKDSTFEFCEPNGWKLLYTEVPGAYFAGQHEITYDADAQPTTESVGGSDSVYEFYVHNKVNEQSEINGFTKKSSTTNSTGLKIDAYYHMTGKQDPIGAGIDYLDEGTEQHKFIVTKNDKKLVFIYLHFMQARDLSELVEKVVASTR
jgi:hypothetical protein